MKKWKLEADHCWKLQWTAERKLEASEDDQYMCNQNDDDDDDADDYCSE